MTSASDTHNGITHAFSTPISYHIHNDGTGLNDLLAQSIRKEAANNVSDDHLRAHQGGYYSQGGFFASGADGAEELAKMVQQSIRQYLAALVTADYAEQTNFKLQTWVGVTRRGDYQTPHVHAGATISGVYYVTVPECAPPQGSIEFVTPVDAQEMSFLRETSHSKITITPQAGGMLLFPSYLRHYTHPFDSDDDRICVVFNVYLNQQKKFTPASATKTEG